MTVDLAVIVRKLEQVEAEHPETAEDLRPVIEALKAPAGVTVGVAQARQILGLPYEEGVLGWIKLGILPGEWDEQSAEWRIPLEAVMRQKAWEEAITSFGGDELSEEELAILSETRPGSWPWQRKGQQ